MKQDQDTPLLPYGVKLSHFSRVPAQILWCTNRLMYQQYHTNGTGWNSAWIHVNLDMEQVYRVWGMKHRDCQTEHLYLFLLWPSSLSTARINKGHPLWSFISIRQTIIVNINYLPIDSCLSDILVTLTIFRGSTLHPFPVLTAPLLVLSWRNPEAKDSDICKMYSNILYKSLRRLLIPVK